MRACNASLRAVATCSLAERYRSYGAMCCLRLWGRIWKQQGSPQLWYITIDLYGVTVQNAVIPIFNDVRTRYFLQKKGWATGVNVEIYKIGEPMKLFSSFDIIFRK